MSLNDDIAILGKLPMLSALEEEALRILLFSADQRVLKTGDVLISKGQRTEGSYFVIEGSFSAYVDPSDTRESGVVRAGALIGEMAMITQTECPATMIAREPSTVLYVPRSIFQRVLREYPASAARLRSMIEQRLGEFTTDLKKLREKLIKE